MKSRYQSGQEHVDSTAISQKHLGSYEKILELYVFGYRDGRRSNGMVPNLTSVWMKVKRDRIILDIPSRFGVPRPSK